MSPDLKKMHKISVIWGCIMFLLVIGVTIVGFVYKNETKKYKTFEKTIVDQASTYLKNNNLTKASLEELIENDAVQLTEEYQKQCTGYVTLKNENYKSYIKCQNYQTKGYES